MTKYHDREGRRITEDKWKQLCADLSYVWVGRTIVRDGRRRRVIETIWAGFNPMEALDDDLHGPKIFATSMSRGSSPPGVHWFTRNTKAATEMHDRVVADAAAELANPVIDTTIPAG